MACAVEALETFKSFSFLSNVFQIVQIVLFCKNPPQVLLSLRR